MGEIKVWNYESSEVRTIEKDGEPWFVGKDVADILGYSNARDALAKRVDAEDKGVAKCDTLGGVQNLTVINESGLYSLILSSKLPDAKKFKRWVTSANRNGLKTEEYGIKVMDKSRYSTKEVPSFRYNMAGVKKLAEILGLEVLV